jgi:hypothetical protein
LCNPIDYWYGNWVLLRFFVNINILLVAIISVCISLGVSLIVTCHQNAVVRQHSQRRITLLNFLLKVILAFFGSNR